MGIGIFDLEVKEKKREAYLNRAKTGSRGGSKSRKGVLTPYDNMTTKEKKKLNGEVSAYNMYETILENKEFALKDEEMQKTLLLRWRDLYDNKKIYTEMGLTQSQYYALAKKLNVTAERVYKPRKAKASKESKKLLQSDLEFTPEPVKTSEPEIKPVLISRGMHFEYNGEYEAESIVKILTKLQLLVEGEENKFNLAISLTERA